MDTLLKLLKGGARTSEFYVTALGLLVVALLPQLDAAVDAGSKVLGAHYGAFGQIAAAAIVAAYTLGRSMVKAKGLGGLLSGTTPEQLPPLPTAAAPDATRAGR